MLTDKEHTELYTIINNIAPAELTRIRGTNKDNSTRDKERLLKKVSEIEDVLQKINIKISLKKE